MHITPSRSFVEVAMAARRPIAGAAQSRFECRLLGGCALIYNGRAIPESAFARRRAFFLLLHVVLAPGNRLTREQAIEMLWPDADPTAAAAGLRAVLSDLRAACSGDGRDHPPIVRVGGQIALDPALSLHVDATAFEHAATEALRDGRVDAMRAAADLYAGPLLPNLLYEDWLERPRHRLADLQERLLSALVAREISSDPGAAELHLRALLELDSTNEARAVELMRLLDSLGRRAEARRVYEDLAAALRTDLDVEPAAETRAAYRALSGPGSAAPPSTTRASRLPAPVTRFIGRSRELDALSALLSVQSVSRLLTLTGAGGSGKTRLALAVAGMVREQYSGGIWLVELAAVQDPRFVARAAAAILEVREEHDQPLERALAAALNDRPALLVLDNCEHQVEASAVLAATLLAACPTLRILATSRERLNTAGELAWRVPSLPLPPAADRVTGVPPAFAELVGADSVQLFADRARLAFPAFTLTVRNAPLVARICTRLDGIPLAIELAASRLSVLPLEGIAARLDDRFRLLTGGSRTALPRQQTLRATLDWSYALLNDEQRDLLCRLAVFTGGWTLEATEGICAPSSDDPSSPPILEPLGALVDKSLVFMDDLSPSGEQRYYMLETVREYARERLIAGDEVRTVLQRYRKWYLDLAERIAPDLIGGHRQHGLRVLDEEGDNLRGLLSWTIVGKGPLVENAASRDPEVALRLVVALWRYWDVRGLWSEGRRWVALALALPGEVKPSLRASGLNAAGALAINQGDVAEAEACWEQALALKRIDGDQQSIASGLNNLSIAVQRRGDYARSAELLEESLAIKRAIDDRETIPYSLNNLGIAIHHLGDYQRAQLLYREAAELWHELGDTLNSAYARLNLAVMLVHLKRPAEAAAIYEQTLAVFREQEEHWGIAAALHNLGNLAIGDGDLSRAEDLYRQSQQLWQHLADKQGLAESLESWAALAHAGARYEHEVRLYAAAAAFRETISTPPPPKERANQQKLLAAARQALGDSAYDDAWSRGRLLTIDEALAFALSASPPK
jgi:predicted ATPase/DNA-binding SARP family transcriptional activator